MNAHAKCPPCPYLNELIALLDEEADTRDCHSRPELVRAMRDLEIQASLAGASALTLSMIHVSKVMLQAGELMPPTLQ